MLDIAVQIILIIFGLFFLYTGVASFFQPEKLAKTLSLNTIGRSGRIEIQAQYGGFFFLAGLSQLAPFLKLLTPSTALTVSVVIFGGLILGRVLSLLSNQGSEPITPIIRVLYVIDAVGFGLAIWALLSLAQGAALLSPVL